MLSGWAAALEGSDLAAGLRNSAWACPLVNAGHLHGVALLVGGSVPLNLRLRGVWRALPLFPLRRVPARTADAGLLLAVAFGFLLFSARASEYIRSGLFVTKMLPLAAVRAVVGFSLAVWLAVLTLGRLIGYFEGLEVLIMGNRIRRPSAGAAAALLLLLADGPLFCRDLLSGRELVDELGRGGYTIYFRHAATDFSRQDQVRAAGEWTSCDPARRRGGSGKP